MCGVNPSIWRRLPKAKSPRSNARSEALSRTMIDRGSSSAWPPASIFMRR